jgi:hypothetical protein
VVPKEQSRTEVMKACQGGDVSIEQLVKNNWLQRIPVESKVSNSCNHFSLKVLYTQ